ncbi:MAG TPA: hypothetical protein VGD63_20555 [Steroidobacteraceae bacterium]
MGADPHFDLVASGVKLSSHFDFKLSRAILHGGFIAAEREFRGAEISDLLVPLLQSLLKCLPLSRKENACPRIRQLDHSILEIPLFRRK